MQLRRWWSAVALLAAVGAWGTGVAQAAPAAATSTEPADLTARMEKATGPDALEVRNDAVAACDAIGDVKARDNYAGELADAFVKGPLASSNPDAVLNAAMTIASLHTQSTDKPLEGMLTNKNSAVRYWAANGLAAIPTLLTALGPITVGRAVASLNTALTKESSGIVRREIMRALVGIGDGNDLLQALDTLSTSIQSATPDQETLEAAVMGLARLPAAVRALELAPPPAGAVPPVPPPTPTQIAKTAGWLASLASQQEVALNKVRTAAGSPFLSDPAKLVADKAYHGTVVKVINEAMKALDAACGKPGTFPQYKVEQSPEEICVLLEGVTGSAGLGAGQVQHVFPAAPGGSGVPVPPKIPAAQ